MAAPKVARAAIFIRKCLEYLLASAEWARTDADDPFGPWIQLPWLGLLDTGWNPKEAPIELGLLAGHAIRSGGEQVGIPIDAREEHWLSETLTAISTHLGSESRELRADPATIRRGLKQVARRIAGQPHEVGAGFVSLREAVGFFASLSPTRFAKLFLGEPASFPELDKRLGPLWDEIKLSVLQDYFVHGVRLSVARVIDS